MSSKDKARNVAKEAKGSVKKKAGDLADNEQWQAEGATEKASGGIRQAIEKVKKVLGGRPRDRG